VDEEFADCILGVLLLALEPGEEPPTENEWQRGHQQHAETVHHGSKEALSIPLVGESLAFLVESVTLTLEVPFQVYEGLA